MKKKAGVEDIENLCGLSEAARALGIAAGTLRYLANTGRIQPVIVTGRRCFRRSDVERLRLERENI
jgi:DNA-binding transcriptional MerR regulator